MPSSSHTISQNMVEAGILRLGASKKKPRQQSYAGKTWYVVCRAGKRNKTDGDRKARGGGNAAGSLDATAPERVGGSS
jgi:hypothetical protein